MSTWTKVVCNRLDITVSLDANVTQVWKNKRWFEESNFQVYWIRYLQVHPSDQILCLEMYVTKPAPIKGAASIQKLFFQSSTMVWFCQITSIFSIFDCSKFNKTQRFFVCTATTRMKGTLDFNLSMYNSETSDTSFESLPSKKRKLKIYGAVFSCLFFFSFLAHSIS